MHYQVMKRHEENLNVYYYVGKRLCPASFHPSSGKTMETMKWSVVVGQYGERGMNKQTERIFRALKILCDIIIIEVNQNTNTFIQTHRKYNIKSEP